MEEKKTLLSIVPPRANIFIWGPKGELMAMQGGPAVGGSLAGEVIDILNGKWDASQLTPETLHEYADLISWSDEKIEVRWKP